MGWPNLALRLALRSLQRPSTGVALLRVAWRFRRRAWYRRFPFLPLPAREYVRWRIHTAYGDSDGMVPTADEMIRYARWAVRRP